MEWVAVIARTIDCNAWAETGIKEYPASRIWSGVEYLFKNFWLLRFKLIYSYLFAMIASCQIYDSAVTMEINSQRIFSFPPCFVMYEFFYEW